MANFNIDAKKEKVYDAIVIGSGISGGWAAKELCEKGLKTLVLERGRIVEHVVDYPTMNLDPWDMELRGGLTPEEKEKHYKNIRSGWWVRIPNISGQTMPPIHIPRQNLFCGCEAIKWGAGPSYGESKPTDGATLTLRRMPRMAMG
jgi:choline dehydrogenase-like flavoprotein